ncbi:hypothetical protein QBC45DRAFT_486359 [Copromyces sp. CBS 386.78]|nr:hypothetical protein QBC45DRAFT_486359 [Copromyces sp. CBS 386.78]
MASSSATPQASVTKAFVMDPKGFFDDLSASVRNIGAKLEDGSDLRKDLDEAADTLKHISTMEWAGFFENRDNAVRITSMTSAALRISDAAGELEDLLAIGAAADEQKIKLIKCFTKTLAGQVKSAKLEPRLTMDDLVLDDDSYTSNTPSNVRDSTWSKARFKQENEEAENDGSSRGDRFDQGPNRRDDGPAL